jgi:aspartate carbamoyltransferase catalytic subunit
VAEKRTGAHVLNFATEKSSLSKGESLEDTIKTLESIGVDIAVIRHTDDYFFKNLKEKCSLSLINAGAGKSEHPSQGLLDLLTIRQEFESLDNLKIAISGDIKHSRVAGSFINYMKNFNSEIFLCGPSELLPAKENLPNHCSLSKIDEVVAQVNVLMLLRVQTERHDEVILNKETYLNEFGLTHQRLETMKDNSIIMHPAPVNRGVEIASDLVEHDKSRIFKQMKNGVFTRMAILDWLNPKETCT